MLVMQGYRIDEFLIERIDIIIVSYVTAHDRAQLEVALVDYINSRIILGDFQLKSRKFCIHMYIWNLHNIARVPKIFH